jgi:hypothetical protein
MLKLFANLFRENILVGIILFILIIWGSYASYISIILNTTKATNYIVIHGDKEPYFYSDKPALMKRAQLPDSIEVGLKNNFFLKFSIYCFSFNKKNFIENLSVCKSLVSRQILTAQKTKIRKIFKNLKPQKLKQTSELLEIVETKDKHIFGLRIRVLGEKKGVLYSKIKKITARITKVTPSFDNAFGYKIEDLDETIL